jgi:hypothetical protein
LLARLRTIPFYRSLDLSDSCFELSSGGTEFTPGVGSDSYTSFSFLVEFDGFRWDTMLTELEDWVYAFVRSLCDQDEDLHIHDETSELDWDEEKSEDDWDSLETGY